MKRYLLLALGVFLAMPAAVGAVDAWCYVLLGRQLTWIAWNSSGNGEGRALMAIMMGLIAFWIAMGVSLTKWPRDQ